MPKITKPPDFQQMYLDICGKLPSLKAEIDQRMIWFQRNPTDTRLDNHALTKKMEGQWAFSITDDIRIVYEWTNKTTARFLAIGPHKKVYSKLT